ncbi:MAG TPA: M57 family metalloprotease [Longimicrobiaceae bacterium]|nr:M57 family metalloprotease [Longimicrobiaceae bacterium]
MHQFSPSRGALVLALAALAACDAPPTATRTAPNQPEDVRAMVEAMGFRGDMVQDFGDYVLVEGDIRLSKAELRANQLPGGGKTGPRYQYRTTNLVSSPKVHQIVVDVSGLSSVPGWQTAARDALTQWSGISGSYVKMVEGSPADITVSTTCTSSNVAAYASFPSGGNPGATVYVNTCFGYSVTSSQQLRNMVHELGHTLGFRHTNYTQLGETAGTEGAIQVTGTPTSGNDANSVMNGGTALNSWIGFSTYDQTAVRALYWLPTVSSLSVTNSGGSPLIGWSAPLDATSFTVRLINYNSVNGNYQNRFFSPVGTTTGTSLLDSENAYTGLHDKCGVEGPDGNIYGGWYEYGIVAQYANGSSAEARIYAPIGEC